MENNDKELVDVESVKENEKISYMFDASDTFGVNDLFSAFLLGILLKSGFDLISYYICEPIRRKWRKECNFDCSSCNYVNDVYEIANSWSSCDLE